MGVSNTGFEVTISLPTLSLEETSKQILSELSCQRRSKTVLTSSGCSWKTWLDCSRLGTICCKIMWRWAAGSGFFVSFCDVVCSLLTSIQSWLESILRANGQYCTSWRWIFLFFGRTLEAVSPRNLWISHELIYMTHSYAFLLICMLLPYCITYLDIYLVGFWLDVHVRIDGCLCPGQMASIGWLTSSWIISFTRLSCDKPLQTTWISWCRTVEDCEPLCWVKFMGAFHISVFQYRMVAFFWGKKHMGAIHDRNHRQEWWGDAVANNLIRFKDTGWLTRHCDSGLAWPSSSIIHNAMDVLKCCSRVCTIPTNSSNLFKYNIILYIHQ